MISRENIYQFLQKENWTGIKCCIKDEYRN